MPPGSKRRGWVPRPWRTALPEHGPPRLGHDGTLLTAERWANAAVAAVSTRTVVEIWRAGRAFRQTLAGLTPVEPPAEFPAPAGTGTRVAFVLDPAFFGSSVITTDTATLDLHGPYCTEAAGPGQVVVRDLREAR